MILSSIQLSAGKKPHRLRSILHLRRVHHELRAAAAADRQKSGDGDPITRVSAGEPGR
jgi:hypothetical protein